MNLRSTAPLFALSMFTACGIDQTDRNRRRAPCVARLRDQRQADTITEMTTTAITATSSTSF